MRWTAVLILAALVLSACGNDEEQSDSCNTFPLPLSGEPGAPTLTEAKLECQGPYINLLITATDPQGDSDLFDVIQTVRVFRDRECQGPFRELSDDLAGSGLEESFGIVFDSSADPDLFSQICSSVTWPIEVELVDAGGHQTAGRVLATVIH